MPLNYNFAFKNSKLKQWERPKPKNILASEKTFKERILYFYQIFVRNPEITFPPGLILIITFAFQMINIYPVSITKRLEDKHLEYQMISKKLSNSQSRIKSMRNYLDSIKVYYSQALPSYLFAYYLQSTIPKGVKIIEYFISENEFYIKASAYEIESLNQMVALLLESPIINKTSLSINKINIEESTKTANVNIEIDGTLLKLNLEKREFLYDESLAYGLSKKLSRFKILEQSIR
tara:strand:+ start:666 stop:1370 length:705 start_codon:yes stop_codon:yes gene_type:complete